MPASQVPESLIATMVCNAADSIAILDHNLTIQFWNRSAERLFGYSSNAAIGKNILELILSDACRAKATTDVNKSPNTCPSGLGLHELRALTKAGAEFYLEVSSTLAEVDGQHWHWWVMRNIDQLKQELLTLRRETVTDALSGLSNRRGFQTSLENALGQPLALAIVDVDQFKEINDKLGHPIGDEVIRKVAAQLREHFPKAVTIGRLGGDEFGVVLPSLTKANAKEQFESFRMQLEKNIELAIPITVSIGVTVSEHANTTARDLLRKADECLYVSKAAGRNKSTVRMQNDSK